MDYIRNPDTNFEMTTNLQGFDKNFSDKIFFFSVRKTTNSTTTCYSGNDYGSHFIYRGMFGSNSYHLQSSQQLCCNQGNKKLL